MRSGTSMVERVENAISDAMNADPRGGSFSRAARAAIEAMREPTEVMVSAAEDHDFPDHLGGKADPATHWRSMIDAALNEEG